MNTIDGIISTLVENMRYAWNVRVIAEILDDDVKSLREDVERLAESTEPVDSEEYFNSVKVSLLSRALNDSKQVEFLVSLPSWLGFRRETVSDNEEHDVTESAVFASISTLWIMMLAKNVVGTTVAPAELSTVPLEPFVLTVLESKDSRSSLESRIRNEIELRNVNSPPFTITDILRGFVVDESVSAGRIPHFVALLMMTSTGLPTDFDKTLTLSLKELSREVTGYILAYHATTALRNAIAGSGARKPFDWPLVGNKHACGALTTIAEVIYGIVRDMVFGKPLIEDVAKSSEPPSLVNVFIYVLEELAIHYEDILRDRRGRGSNEDLENFIDILRGEKRNLATKLSESEDRGDLLYQELQLIKKKGKGGWRPYLSPEKRYSNSLAALEAKLKIKSTNRRLEQTLIDDLGDVFSAASEMIELQEDFLEDNRVRFAEAIFSETSFEILDFVGLGGHAMELPWISRFIAEEAVDAYAKMGIYDVVSEENKIDRLMAAYMGGLVYLILQDHKREKVPVTAH
jgi:hypothetical protein